MYIWWFLRFELEFFFFFFFIEISVSLRSRHHCVLLKWDWLSDTACTVSCVCWACDLNLLKLCVEVLKISSLCDILSWVWVISSDICWVFGETLVFCKSKDYSQFQLCEGCWRLYYYLLLIDELVFSYFCQIIWVLRKICLGRRTGNRRKLFLWLRV